MFGWRFHKTQIFRNWTEVVCFELWKKSVAWIPFLCFYFHCSFFLGQIIFVSNFSHKFIILLLYNGIAPLIFCLDLISTKNSSTYYFFLLSQFHYTFNTFYAFNFERNLIVLFPKRIIWFLSHVHMESSWKVC